MKKNQKIKEERKTELKQKLDQYVYILIAAKQCLLFSKDLRFSSDEKLNAFLHRSEQLAFIHNVLWKQCVIELAKLISPSKRAHRYNIHHLIDQLKDSGHFGCLEIDKTVIQCWQNKIAENQGRINSIMKLRDKAYAHTEPSFDIYKIDAPTFANIEELIRISEGILEEVYKRIFNTGLVLDRLPHYDDRFASMLKDLVEYQERRQKELVEKLRERPFG